MKNEDKQRLEMEAVPVHHISGEVDSFNSSIHFPINHHQVRDLLGKLLTQLDSMNLPERAHAANKAVIIQHIWRWFDTVVENSNTSYKGCIGPIDAKKRAEELGFGNDPAHPKGSEPIFPSK